MIAFLLANWKSCLAVIATAALAWLLHSLDVYRLEDAQRAALATQAQTLTNQCNAEKAITTGVSNDFQSKLKTVSDQLAALKRVRPDRCVPVSAASTAGRRDAASGSAFPARPDAGVDSDALLDFAAEAERYRLQLISCQEFITETWAENAK